MLVVQGESDPFGMPPGGPNRTVARIPGTHSLKSSATVAPVVSEWLARLGLDVQEHIGESRARSEGTS
jgi:hypothetical protein